MRGAQTITKLIGRTPLVELPVRSAGWRVLAKLEMFNPGGSIKDRTALGLITAAERQGCLRPGMTIVESTSGNTGVALAMLAAERGYTFVAVVDTHALPEKIVKIKALGGRIQYCNTDHLPAGQVGVDVRRQVARAMAQADPSCVCLDQYDNPANPEFYSRTLGEELLCDTDGEIDVLIGAVGTGSALCGVGRRLKEHNPNTRIYAVEPEGSISFGKPGKVYHQSGPGFPSGARIPRNLDHALIDRDFQVSDHAAFHTMRYLARACGFFIGDSGGAVLYQTMQVVQSAPEAPDSQRMLVALICDGGQPYLSHAYDDAWMQRMGFMPSRIEASLERFFGSAWAEAGAPAER